MGKYLGRDVAYGLFDKQVLVPDGVSSEFSLIYQVGSSGSMLINYAGTILEPLTEYNITEGGTKVQFSFVPQVGYSLYIIYMGKEMQVPSVAGAHPQLVQAIGDGVIDAFNLPLSPLTVAGLLVFKNGIQQRANLHFTLSGNVVTFLTPPAFNDLLDFYILGIERTDLVTVDPLAITNDKIGPMAVTADKLNLLYTAYASALDTFGGMNIDSSTIHIAEYIDQGRCIKLRFQATVTLSGTPDNKIRFLLPIPNNGSTLVTGSVTLSSATTLENGIIRWGSVNHFDIHRQFGVNYEANPTEWTVEVDMEYESA